MGSKRTKKNEKRTKRKAAKLQQRDRRETRIRLPLEHIDGAAKLASIDKYLCTERDWTAGPSYRGGFEQVLENIRTLNLMLLEEHKHHMAAFLIQMERKHQNPGWRSAWSRLYESSDKLNRLSDEIELISDMHQRMVAWLVTGDELWLDQVIDITRDTEHPFGKEAANILGYYCSRFIEVEDHLKRRSSAKIELTDPGCDELRRILMRQLNWRTLVFVRREGDTYIIGTKHGDYIEGAPVVHNDLPVIHRQAEYEDIVKYQRMQQDMEDPI